MTDPFVRINNIIMMVMNMMMMMMMAIVMNIIKPMIPRCQNQSRTTCW